MKLVGFSQGVSLSKKMETVSYLEFEKNDGTTFRIPVQQESIEKLLPHVYAEAGQEAPAEDIGAKTSAVEPEATVFGEESQVPPLDLEEEAPESEEEVPSL